MDFKSVVRKYFDKTREKEKTKCQLCNALISYKGNHELILF